MAFLPIYKLYAVIGISLMLFSVSLFIIRVPVRTIAIFAGIGAPLVAIWLYIDYKQTRPPNLTRDQKHLCACQVCHHDIVASCEGNDCKCCLVEKDGKVIGHSLTGLQ